MTEEQRLHRELLQAFYEYVKCNLRYETNKSMRSTVDIRRELFKIRNLAKKRGDILLGIKKETKSELQKKKNTNAN